ncbi:hypothetical protein ACFLWU_00640 [Chloroflexota bacterium]
MNSKRVLWVEDDHYRLRRLVNPLIKEGIEVTFIGDVESAKKAIEMDGGFNLYLIDLIIPESARPRMKGDPAPQALAGIELIKHIRNIYGNSIPILVLTIVKDENVQRVISSLNAKWLTKGILKPSELRNELLTLI